MRLKRERESDSCAQIIADEDQQWGYDRRRIEQDVPIPGASRTRVSARCPQLDRDTFHRSDFASRTLRGPPEHGRRIVPYRRDTSKA